MKVHNETDMPGSIADLHCEVFPDLAKLLFDPTLNRLQIQDAIASHQPLSTAFVSANSNFKSSDSQRLTLC